MSLDSPNSDARSGRIHELVGKIMFDDPRVFKRLALHRVSAQLVADCAQSFITDQDVLDARRELENITAETLSHPIEELDEDDDGYPFERDEEKQMYGPLTSIFRHIENFDDSSGTGPRYSFQDMDSTVLELDSSAWGFLKGSPDFGMVKHSTGSVQKRVPWRDNWGFCEVKPIPQEGPKSTDPKDVSPLICQAADHARLHLSARPFQLFSIGLLIFGSQFCIAIFDRAGVVLSPIHNVWEDIEIFIRVVRSLTCHLSCVELGQDPTVTTLPDEEHKEWRNQTMGLGPKAPEDFPTFVIMMGSRSWNTIGFPIWISVSLLGRGTTIWLVREGSNGPVLVLKNTWRSAFQISESKIYGSIRGHHPALAEFQQGEDVCFPGEPQGFITAHSLRGPTPDDNFEGTDVFLHRLIIKNRGRPLWESHTEKELLQGIRAALSAHQFLCEQGILHRDISAGNILLSAHNAAAAGAEGFLMDLEFAARIDATKSIVATPYVRRPGGGMIVPPLRTAMTVLHSPVGGIIPPDVRSPEAMHGAVMTGTAQFMAEELLLAILNATPIEHEPHHDIESFIHVLAYSVTRRVVLKSQELDEKTRKKLLSFFNSTFACMDFCDIWASRRAQDPLTFRFRFPTLISAPMVELMDDLELWQRKSTMPPKWNFPPLTHAYMLSALDEAISKMV